MAEVRGLSLLSGGLDSMLAVAVLAEQGIRMESVVFDKLLPKSGPVIGETYKTPDQSL